MKSIGKLFLIVFTVLLTIMVLLVGSVFLFQDKLKSVAIDQVNQHIKVPVSVKGGVAVSLFTNFPNVSVNLNDVSIADPLRKKQNLISLRKVSLLFNLYEVFNENKKIREIILENGTLFLLEDAKGKKNFDILKETQDTTTSLLELQSVVLRNIELSYKSVPSKSQFKAAVNRAKLNGNFGGKIMTLKNNADFDWDFLRLNADTFKINKNVSLNLNLTIDTEKKSTLIEPSTMEIGDNSFALDGNINSAFKEFTDINIALNCEGKEIASLLSLLPNSVQQNMQGAKGKGEYAININISGRSGKDQIPKVQAHAKLKNGTLSFPKLANDITNINMELMYDNKKEVLSLPKFQANYDDKPISFSLSVINLSHRPAFILVAEGIVNFKALQTFISDKYIQKGEGEIEFNAFELSGNLDEQKQLIPRSLNGSGSFAFRDVMFLAENVQYNNINGFLSYKNGNLDAKGLTVDFLKSQFYFNGIINNFFAYIIEKVKRQNNTTLLLDGSLAVKNFNLDEMLKAFKREEKQKQETLSLREIFNIDGNLQIGMDKFQYQQLEFGDIKSTVNLKSGQIKINSFSCRAMGGELTNTGVIQFSEQEEMILSGNIQVHKMELPKIFSQSNNFGQTTLTDKHLKGMIDAEVSYRAVFNNYKNIDLSKLNATASCNITKGELINFEPIRAASSFIRVEDLNHIYFSDLKNQLVIKNNRVEIPQMEIQSNAMNLLLNGTHTFENDIDYHIKINLRKLLANKFRKNNDSEYIEEDPYEGANIYLSLSGNMAKPHIKYDKQYTKKKIESDFKKEKENLKNIFKKDALPAEIKDATKEDKYFNTREKPVFMDWEE